jgi:hypothetical protein
MSRQLRVVCSAPWYPVRSHMKRYAAKVKHNRRCVVTFHSRNRRENTLSTSFKPAVLILLGRRAGTERAPYIGSPAPCRNFR